MALWKMSNLKNLVAALASLALLTVPFSVFAAYSQLKLPSGYSSPKTVGSSGTFKSGTAANDTVYRGSTVLTNAALEVGGQSVTVPVALRIAANAGTLAATYSFGNPLLFAGIAAGNLLYEYFSAAGLKVENGSWKIKDPNICTVGPCYEYNATDGRVDGYWTSSAPSACQAYAAKASAQTGYPYTFNGMYAPDQCRIGYPGGEFGQGVAKREIPVQAPVLKPATVIDFESLIANQPLPVSWPKFIPEFDVPVEPPIVFPLETPVTNPTPFGQPAPNPATRWVPTGDPVKNPNPDPGVKPDTWTQPGKDVKPSGVPNDPWRVDVTDNPKTKSDPSPNTDTTTPTTTTPTPTDFQTCGLPGKPKCAIDETGTPTYDPKKVELDKATLDPAASSQRDKVSSGSDKSSIFQGFSQFFSLPPLAACTPVVMPSIAGQQIASMDVCPGAEWLRGLMGFVWAVAGFLFVFRTVEDVI